MNSRMILLSVVLLAVSVVEAQNSEALSLSSAQALMTSQLTATGRAMPLVSARVSPRVSGRIDSFEKSDTGEGLDAGMRVKVGQVLFKLESMTFQNAVDLAQASLESAEASLKDLTAPTREEQIEQLRQAVNELNERLTRAKDDEQRFGRLVAENTLPEERLKDARVQRAALEAQLAAAKARQKEAETGPTPTQIAVAAARVKEAEVALKIAKADLADTVVRAPFDGVITQRFKNLGDYLTNMPPTDVLEIVATDRLEVELRLPEAYLAGVEAGKTPIRLRSPLLAGQVTAVVTRVIPSIDPVKGTFAVRVAVPTDQQGKLVAGAFVTAEMEAAAESAEVIIPARSVVAVGGKSAVFIAEGGKMVRREVEVGDRLTEGVVIRSGLTAGQKVLVGPHELLNDGAELPAALAAEAARTK